MEFLEAFPVLPGRHHRLFHRPAYAGVGGGGAVLLPGVCHDSVYHHPKADFRGPGVGLAVLGLHYPDDKRRPVFLYRHPGAISGQNLHGGEKAPHLPGEGGILKNLKS